MSESVKCAYCGQHAVEKEHVVAKSLLVDRDTPVIVPSCSECNKAKSLDDDYLRDVFAIRLETSGLPQMREKRDKMVRSALRQGRMSPGKGILSTFHKRPVVLPGGRTILWQGVVKADRSRIFRGIRWIVRGLYYRHFQTTLPLDADLRWRYFEGEEQVREFEAIWPRAQCGPFVVGSCLSYKINAFSDVPGYSEWVLVFYDRLLYVFTVNEESLLAKLAELDLSND